MNLGLDNSMSWVLTHWSLPPPISQMRKLRFRNVIADHTELRKVSPSKVSLRYKLNFSGPFCYVYEKATMNKALYSVL